MRMMTEVKPEPRTSLVVLLRGNLTKRQSRQAMAMVLLLCFFSAVEVVGLGSVLPFITALAHPAAVRARLGLDGFLKPVGIVSDRDFQVALTVLLIGVFALKNLAVGFGEHLRLRWSYRLAADLSKRLLTHYMRQDYSFFLNANAQNLLKNITNEAWTVVSGAVLPLLMIISELLVGGMLYALLLMVNYKLTLIGSVTLLSLGLLIYAVVRRNVARVGRERERTMGCIYQDLGTALTGIKAIKVTEKAEYFIRRVANHFDEYTRGTIYYNTMGIVPRLALECVAVVAVVAVLMGMLFTQATDFSQSVPIITLYSVAIYRFMPSVNRIITSRLAIKYNLRALEVVAAALSEGTAGEMAALAGQPPGRAIRFASTVSLRDVSFQYNRDQAGKMIDGLTLEIRKGQTIGLVGVSGSGKTTVVDILLGLLFPDDGSVEVDGRPLGRDDMAAWHALIGYIPQEISLYDDTLLRNVAFGVEDPLIDREAVMRVIRAAQLDELVKTLPAGLDTVVGDRGVRLSGGQRQRVAIARALYRDPEILVFDEATSSLDSVTELEISKAIEWLGTGKTIIIIAHRLTTVTKCDAIFLLEKGRVVASGTYQELMERSEMFKRLALA
jgi:ABC-type multidrug transport system fused ATPase/permease subunit